MGNDGASGASGGSGGEEPEKFTINGMSFVYVMPYDNPIGIDGNRVTPHNTAVSSAIPLAQMNADAEYYIEIDVDKVGGAGPIIRGGFFNSNSDNNFSDGATFSFNDDPSTLVCWIDQEDWPDQPQGYYVNTPPGPARACFLIKGTRVKAAYNGNWFNPADGTFSEDASSVAFVDISSFSYLTQPAGLFFMVYNGSHTFLDAANQLYRPAGAIACEFTNFVNGGGVN